MIQTIKIIGLIAMFFCLSAFVLADIIPENSHSLDKCVKIINIDAYPEVVLIGFITGPMVDTYEAYLVENDQCLTMGYKFNQLSIYWTTAEMFASLDLDNLEVTNNIPSDLNLALNSVSPYGGYIDNSNPLVKETIEYSILGFSGDDLVLEMTSRLSEYNDGSPNMMENFDYPTPTPYDDDNPVDPVDPIDDVDPIPPTNPDDDCMNDECVDEVGISFWKLIGCFFKNLFGSSC